MNKMLTFFMCKKKYIPCEFLHLPKQFIVLTGKLIHVFAIWSILWQTILEKVSAVPKPSPHNVNQHIQVYK